MFGFLNIYKPEGLTSHDVVAKLRRVTKIKQIGHTGTLDPFAEGVLPVCIGKSTRLIEYLEDDKEYLASVQFGKNTDTYDVEGQITAEFDKKVTRDEVFEALKIFEGEILQYPPAFSAIKIKGKKLYEYARQGQKVEIQPRKVFIEKIESCDFHDAVIRLAEMAKMEREIDATCLKDDSGRVFLDTLNPLRGDMKQHAVPSCSIICEIEFQNLIDKQTEKVMKGEMSIYATT